MSAEIRRARESCDPEDNGQRTTDNGQMGTYHDHGIHFEYPSDWDVDVTDDGSRTTVSVTEPGGTAFALVTLDDDRPAASDLVDEALEAMRAEYPGLDADPAVETIDGHKAVGHDLEFITLDLLGECAIRCFRTKRRTILVMGQWSESVDGDYAQVFRALRQSIAEVDDAG